MSVTPEQLHLAVNHLVFLGSGFALLPILVGILKRNRTTLVVGLLMSAAAGWTTGLAMYSGEEAYERYEHGSVRQFLDPKFEEVLHVHEERAEDCAWVLYGSAGVSTLALIWVLVRETSGYKVAWLAALFALATLVTGMWIAKSGGEIRRPDFRSIEA